MQLSLVLLCALLGFAISTKYEGYKVYKVLAKTESENQLLLSLEKNQDFDFWSKINKVGHPVSVMVSPSQQQSFENVLKEHSINYSVEIKNVEKVIQEEKSYHNARKNLIKGRIAFDQYLRHDEINAYLEQLAQDYPNVVTVSSAGKSYEGRDMKYVRISSGADSQKPVIFVDAGIHAREWIAPAFALYLINQLVENSSNNYLIKDVDWIVLPSVNPDGYEYCWTKDRLWRKTVSKGSFCNGCDPNRNWDFHWMETGASNFECSEIYAGSKAFSEIETRNLRDLILATENVKAYLTFHSYGQYLLYPWGWTSDLPENWKELDDLGNNVNKAISNVAGTEYEVGSSTRVLYAAAGASDDWSMGVGGIDIVYTIELPGGGSYGFDLPASRISSVCVETFEGIKVIHDYVVKK